MPDNTQFTTQGHAHSAEPTTVPLPAGAVRVEDGWHLDPAGPDGVPVVYRGFAGTLRAIDRNDRDIEVELGGIQYMSGRVQREIYVTDIDGPLTLA